MLYQITAPHFCAGLEVAPGGVVYNAAPILRWTIGKQYSYVSRYCQQRGWKTERVA